MVCAQKFQWGQKKPLISGPTMLYVMAMFMYVHAQEWEIAPPHPWAWKKSVVTGFRKEQGERRRAREGTESYLCNFLWDLRLFLLIDCCSFLGSGWTPFILCITKTYCTERSLDLAGLASVCRAAHPKMWGYFLKETQWKRMSRLFFSF